MKLGKGASADHSDVIMFGAFLFLRLGERSMLKKKKALLSKVISGAVLAASLIMSISDIEIDKGADILFFMVSEKIDVIAFCISFKLFIASVLIRGIIFSYNILRLL